MSSRKSYAVYEIIAEKIHRGHRMFNVAWKSKRRGNKKSSTSWEPIGHVRGCIEYVVRRAKRSVAEMACEKCRSKLFSYLQEQEKQIDTQQQKLKQKARQKQGEGQQIGEEVSNNVNGWANDTEENEQEHEQDHDQDYESGHNSGDEISQSESEDEQTPEKQPRKLNKFQKKHQNSNDEIQEIDFQKFAVSALESNQNKEVYSGSKEYVRTDSKEQKKKAQRTQIELRLGELGISTVNSSENKKQVPPEQLKQKLQLEKGKTSQKKKDKVQDKEQVQEVNKDKDQVQEANKYKEKKQIKQDLSTNFLSAVMKPEKKNCKVFIGHIPESASEQDMLKALKSYGQIISSNFVKDPKTGKRKGFAFVEYQDKKSASEVIKKLNGLQLSANCKLRVEKTH